MVENNKNIFGVEADDQSLQSKQGGVFGLNSGTISKLEFVNKEATEDSEAYKAVAISVKVADRDYYNTIYLNESVYGKNNVILNRGDEGFEDAFYAHYAQVIAVVKHILNSVGVTKNSIAAAVSGLDNTKLIEGLEKLLALVPADYSSKPVNVFLEYQWSIPEGKDRTFLTLPKNMKGGYFITPLVTPVGKWTEILSEDGLHYVDNSGNKHPFTRDANFMGSKKGKQQILGEEKDSIDSSPISDASQSTWG